MREVDLGGGGKVHFVYDAAGERVRKVWEHSGIVEERIYLGGYEVYRRREGPQAELVLERQTLHVMDDAHRVALVETKTVDTGVPPFAPASRIRYQLGNHLGSAELDVDEAGLVISYEEYHPFGTTAYHAVRSAVEVAAKRYRYTGKERDEETGLYYHGARYYAAWLGRWTSADPAGMVDGPGLYTYVRNNPVRLVDLTGHLGTVLEFLDDLVNHPSSAIAKGVLENLDKRGEAAVKAPAAVAETLRKYGPSGFLKAIGGGAHHLVRDTGEALGEITWEVKHYEGDSSKEKIARRTVDVVLNTADAVTLVQGGVNIGKGLASGGKAVAQTVKGAAQTLKPAYALATGTRAGAAALEAAVAGAEGGGASIKALGTHLTMMSTVGKGAGSKPTADMAKGSGSRTPHGRPPTPQATAQATGGSTVLTRIQANMIERLRSGSDVVVSSIAEARRLLQHMPDLQPFTSAKHLPTAPAPKGTYRGDLLNTRDPTAPFVHPPDSAPAAHSLNPHYNLRFGSGKKAAIIIRTD